MNLVYRHVLLEITDGGAVDGTPSFSSAVNVKTVGRNLTISDRVSEIRVDAWGDLREVMQPNKARTDISFEAVVTNTGRLAFTLGNYARVAFTPITGGTQETYDGYFSEVGMEVRDGQELIQRISVVCDADGT